MRCILNGFNIRFSKMNQHHSYRGDLYANDNGEVEIRGINRQSAPITMMTPHAIYDEKEHKVLFTIPGMKLLRDRDLIDMFPKVTEAPCQDIVFMQ